MRTGIPTGITESAYDLEPDGLVFLYQLVLAGGATTFRFCPKGTYTWQSKTYDQIACLLAEATVSSDGKVDRPTFTLVNPSGMFTQYAVYGLENAILTRYQVLRDDLVNNRNFFIKEAMRIAQVQTITKDIIVCQLRDVMDGASFVLPVRSYIPPEFPIVKI
jgi:phage-related protein